MAEVLFILLVCASVLTSWFLALVQLSTGIIYLISWLYFLSCPPYKLDYPYTSLYHLLYVSLSLPLVFLPIWLKFFHTIPVVFYIYIYIYIIHNKINSGCPWVHSRAWNCISRSTYLLHDVWLHSCLIEAFILEHLQMADVHHEVCKTGWWQSPLCLLVSAGHCQEYKILAGEVPTWGEQMYPVDLYVFALFLQQVTESSTDRISHTEIRIWIYYSGKPF